MKDLAMKICSEKLEPPFVFSQPNGLILRIDEESNRSLDTILKILW